MLTWRYIPWPVLVTTIAPALGLLALAVAFPFWVLLALMVGSAITVAGALWIAAEAAERRNGRPCRRPWNRLAPASGIGVVLGVVAILLGAPGLFVKDAGELSAAGMSLGVAHPTGFPAFCMAMRALGFLPLGSLPFRGNLLSFLSLAASGALAAALVTSMAWSQEGDRARRIAIWTAALSGLTLWASPTTWLHGVTTEVYQPSLVGLGGIALCAALGVSRRDPRWLVVGAFLLGLGLGGHLTWSLWGSVLLSAGTVGTLRRTRARGPVLAAMLVAAMLGAVVIGYLPVRAGRDPLVDWGHPAEGAGLWAHLTGARIRASFQSYLSGMTPALIGEHLGQVLRHLWEGTAPMLVCALMGLVLEPGKDRTIRWALVAVVLGDLWFAVRINPMGIQDLQVNTPATWAVAVLGGDGLRRMAERWSAGLSGRGARVGIAVATIALGVTAWTSPADRTLRHLHAPREVVEGIGEELPPGASLLTTTDDLSATMMAMQVLEGLRPDLLALVRQHLGDVRGVRRRLEARGGRPGEEAFRQALESAPFEADGESPGVALDRAIEALRRRGEVFLEPGEGGIDEAWMGRMWPGFPALHLTREFIEDFPVGAVREAVRKAMTHAPSADRWTRAFLGSAIRGLGNLLARRGMDDQAVLRYREALLLDPTDARAMHNLAVLWRARGNLEEALRWARMAVEMEGGYTRGWATLAKVAEAAGARAEAERAWSRWRALGGEAPAP